MLCFLQFPQQLYLVRFQIDILSYYFYLFIFTYIFVATIVFTYHFSWNLLLHIFLTQVSCFNFFFHPSVMFFFWPDRWCKLSVQKTFSVLCHLYDFITSLNVSRIRKACVCAAQWFYFHQLKSIFKQASIKSSSALFLF